LAVKKPNPRNTENVAKIGELEERIKRYSFQLLDRDLYLTRHRLETERAQLKAMREPAPVLPPLLDESGSPPSPSTLDPALLDTEDANILSFLRTSSSSDLVSKVGTRLKSLQENIEFQVDQFADGVHKLEQACQTMEVVTNKVLALSAVRLDKRENEEREKIGTKDLPIQEVLRTLSRIIPTGGA
jgi:kinetochore protein Mis13/DSN1